MEGGVGGDGGDHAGSFQTGTREGEPVSIRIVNQPKMPEKLTKRVNQAFGKIGESLARAILKHIEDNPLP